MIRSFCNVVGFAALAFACASPMLASGCKSNGGVGDPCTPEQEYDPTFAGFDSQEVNVESRSFQCQTRLCLVNHFQGRVSCPYGQDVNGNAPSGAKSCVVPGTCDKITGPQINGQPADPKKGLTVPPQCTDRIADKAVYCSCRCANIDGKTDDGANYCTCPDGFTCSQLVTSIGPNDNGLTGAYCIKNGTAFDRNNACQVQCSPAGKSTQCTGPANNCP